MPKLQVRVVSAKNLDLVSDYGTAPMHQAHAAAPSFWRLGLFLLEPSRRAVFTALLLLLALALQNHSDPFCYVSSFSRYICTRTIAYQEPWAVVKLGRLTSTIKASAEKELLKKNPNPLFNQVLDLEFEDVQTARLEVEIHDVDSAGRDHVIGALRLRLQNLARRIASVSTYRLTCPGNPNSKAELELSLEAQDFDTSDASPSSSGPSAFPVQPKPTQASQLAGSGGFPHSQVPSANSSNASSSSGLMPPPSAPHAVFPSQSPVNQPHHQPSRASISVAPEPVQFNPRDIKRMHPHIAKGSYGVVYKGTVPGIKDIVVIKDMDYTNQKALDDWSKEIRMMAKTMCDYVVRVIGYSTAERTLTIVMEYMTKGSLYDVLHNRKEPLSVITRMRMARHCALGLQHLHDLKVMHRDVKSMNILVSDSYSCKLTDFGCAKSLNEQGAILNTANSGTPLWMAPEVKAGHYDYSADIYSLGLVIYELLENKLPQYDQIRGSVLIPAQYDSRDIVQPCLSSNPNKRPKASDVVHKLDCVIRNIIESVRKSLKDEELKQLGLSESSSDDKLDAEIATLYQILLRKDPKAVDEMVYKAFGSSPEKASANRPDPPAANQMAPGLPYPGQPGMFPPQMMPGMPPMAPFPGMPPGFGVQPAYATPPGALYVRACALFPLFYASAPSSCFSLAFPPLFFMPSLQTQASRLSDVFDCVAVRLAVALVRLNDPHAIPLCTARTSPHIALSHRALQTVARFVLDHTIDTHRGLLSLTSSLRLALFQPPPGYPPTF